MKRALAERAKQETEGLSRGTIGSVLGMSSSEIQLPPTDSLSPMDTPSLSTSQPQTESESGVVFPPSALISQKIPRFSSATASHGHVSSPQDKLVLDAKMFSSAATPSSTVSEVQNRTMISPPLSSPSEESNQKTSVSNPSSFPQSMVSTPATATTSMETSNPIPLSLSSVLKNPKKRSRSLTATPVASSGVEVLSTVHTSVDGDDSAVDNYKGFYLIQQNRALASELFQYKRIIQMLEEERAVRRQECCNIAQVLGSMISSWRATETILVGLLQNHFVSYHHSQLAAKDFDYCYDYF